MKVRELDFVMSASRCPEGAYQLAVQALKVLLPATAVGLEVPVALVRSQLKAVRGLL